MNDHARREVYAEAKILQELSHPTIIKYFVARAYGFILCELLYIFELYHTPAAYLKLLISNAVMICLVELRILSPRIVRWS